MRTVALVGLVSSAADIAGAQRGALAGYTEVLVRQPHPTASDAAAPEDMNRASHRIASTNQHAVKRSTLKRSLLRGACGMGWSITGVGREKF